MGYRIDYDGMEKQEAKKGDAPLRYLTAVFLALFLIGVSHYWEAGRQKLCSLLLPDARISAAVEQFAEDLRQGESIPDAVAAFYLEMVYED